MLSVLLKLIIYVDFISSLALSFISGATSPEAVVRTMKKYVVTVKALFFECRTCRTDQDYENRSS